MTDIVERLRDYVLDDHERGCQGRYYDCSCGYDGKRDPLMGEAAAEIGRLRAWNAEIALNAREFAADNERLRAVLEDIAYPNPLHNEDDLMGIARAALEGRT